MNNEAYIVPNHTGPTEAIAIDERLCIGCNSCANICRIQTILPNPEKGGIPVVAYPDECWYCGCCVEACPTGALQMRLPINQRVFFKDAQTGEIFRIGGAESPEKSFFRPPFGWLDSNEANGVWKALDKADRPVVAYISDGAAVEIGRWFNEEKGTDCGGKLAAFLRKIGFNKVYRGEKPAVTPGVYTVFFGDANPGADCSLTARQAAAMLHHGCVSRYTAVHVWESLESEEFDTQENGLI